MRTNRMTVGDEKLPRNLRRVLSGVRKPRTAEERALLAQREKAETDVRRAAGEARAKQGAEAVA